MEELLLHPPLVHFAIVLPIVALVFQIAYSVSNNYIYSQWSARVLLISAMIMTAAWYTGGLQGQDVYPLLSEEGQTVLKQHNNLGIFLMLLTVFLALIKLYACRVKNVFLETIVLIGLFTASTAVAYQGLTGGDVVYKHGGGVEKYSDGMDCLEKEAGSAEKAG